MSLASQEKLERNFQINQDLVTITRDVADQSKMHTGLLNKIMVAVHSGSLGLSLGMAESVNKIYQPLLSTPQVLQRPVSGVPDPFQFVIADGKVRQCSHCELRTLRNSCCSQCKECASEEKYTGDSHGGVDGGGTCTSGTTAAEGCELVKA